MSKYDCDISFSNFKAMEWELSSPPGVCVTIPFTVPHHIPNPFHFPFLFSVTISVPFSSFVPFLFTVPFSLPCMSSWPLILFLQLPWRRIAPSTAQCSGIRPVLIMIIFFNYLIPIPWSNVQEVAWLVLPAVWQLNFCPEIIVTVQRQMNTGVFILLQPRLLPIGAMDLIPEGTVVVSPPIVEMFPVFDKLLAHISAEGNSPLPKRWTPAHEVRQLTTSENTNCCSCSMGSFAEILTSA